MDVEVEERKRVKHGREFHHCNTRGASLANDLPAEKQRVSNVHSNDTPVQREVRESDPIPDHPIIQANINIQVFSVESSASKTQEVAPVQLSHPRNLYCGPVALNKDLFYFLLGATGIIR